MSSGSTGKLYHLLLDLFADGIGELGCRGGASQIPCADSSLLQDSGQRRADPFRTLAFAEVIEHQQAGQQQRRRVRQVLIGNVGSAAVDRFEDRRVGSEV